MCHTWCWSLSEGRVVERGCLALCLLARCHKRRVRYVSKHNFAIWINVDGISNF